MQTTVKKIDSTKRELSIEVAGDIIKNKFEDVLKRIGKEAKVPGFRPGHAPRDILEKRYSADIHEQMIKELVPEAYNDAVKKEGMDVLDLPQITDVKLEATRLSFKAVVEVGPQINIKDYKKLKVNYEKINVTPDEIKRYLDSLKEARKLDALDDNFAKSMAYPNLGELEKGVEKQLYTQKENQQRQKIENALVESLTKGIDFKIPESLIKRQLDELLRHAKVDLMMKGFPREKVDEQEQEMIKHLEPEAKEQVRVYLVLAEIAKRENIPADDNMPRKVMEFLLREADWPETP